MDNKQKELLLSALMMSAQRKRAKIVSQLSAATDTIYKSVYAKRQKFRKVYVAQNGTVPNLIFNANVPRLRNIARKERSENNHWWTLQQPGQEDMFFNTFRMGKQSFDLLCEKLEPLLKTDGIKLVSQSLTIEKQVGLCLYKLVSSAEYRVVGDVFGVHKSTVHKYFHLVVNALVQMKSEFIKFPQMQQALEIALEFEKKSHIPNIIGAIDDTHIPILPPNEGFADYINNKGWASIVMQGVVDNNYKFTDVSVKLPECKKDDAKVFKETDLYKNSNKLIPKYTKLLNNVEVPMFLVGDPSYPLLPWLMKPYVESPSDDEELFNCQLSLARNVAEHAFRRLKGRWTYLAKKIDGNPSFVPQVVIACTILHNFLEDQKESFSESWTLVDPDDPKYPQPHDANSKESLSQGNIHPKDIRCVLKNYINEHDQLCLSLS